MTGVTAQATFADTKSAPKLKEGQPKDPFEELHPLLKHSRKNVNPEDIGEPIPKKTWLIRSYGTLGVLALLCILFTSQKLVDLDYSYTIGAFNGDDFYYTVDDKDYVTRNIRDVYIDNSSTKKPNRGWTSSKESIQLVHYRKGNPTELHFTLARNGGRNLTSFWNWALLILIGLGVANLFFTRFAYSKAAAEKFGKSN